MGDSVHSQEELQARIYAVHVDLRKKYRDSVQTADSKNVKAENLGEASERGWEAIWKEHTGNLETLKDYSKAMHELATKIWNPRNIGLGLDSHDDVSDEKIKCRIEWVVSKCQIYFTKKVGTGNSLRLLDVGSCYNPFSKYDNLFDILAIDLCPAPGFEESVYQADFLEIEITDHLEQDNDFELKSTCSYQIAKLVESSFDILVFSFFLEYLPNPKQRLESCQRAHKLLRPSGLLFILRPDSNSVTASTMKFIKEMKGGMGLIGFQRLWCEKLKHLWCTAYVKLNEEEQHALIESARFQKDLGKVKFVELAQLFSIPQDFKAVEILKDNEHVDQKIDVDPTLFGELPNVI